MIGTSSRSSILTFDDLRLTCHAWYPDRSVAQVLFDAAAASPTSTQLVELEYFLRGRGFRGAITGALHPSEQPVFEKAGFSPREELYILRHDQPSHSNVRSDFKTQRARKSDTKEAIELDHLSFETDWRLDEQGFVDAQRATPRSRFRVVRNNEAVIGYAITGRSGQAGYVQRLATHPDLRNKGIGKSLAVDAIKWCSRWHVKTIFVNTQLHNYAALRLYKELGFEELDYRLTIMQVMW